MYEFHDYFGAVLDITGARARRAKVGVWTYLMWEFKGTRHQDWKDTSHGWFQCFIGSDVVRKAFINT